MSAERALRPARKARSNGNVSGVCSGPVVMLSLLAVSVMLVGCDDGRPQRLKVSGQVLIDGKPLTHGYVRFVPQRRPPIQFQPR